MELPLAVVERVMRRAGADRLEENAVIAMRESAQEIAEEVAEDAVRISGEGTVTSGDVENALEA